jgi:hypothetical protein
MAAESGRARPDASRSAAGWLGRSGQVAGGSTAARVERSDRSVGRTAGLWLGRSGRSAGGSAGLALALYAPSALLSVLAAAPMLLVMSDLSRLGPWASQIASGDYANVLLEVASTGVAGAALGGGPSALGPAASALLLALLAAAAGVGAHSLAYAAIAGGVLARLGGDLGTPLPRLCAGWLWPMLRLQLLAGLIASTLGLLGAVGVGLVGLVALGRLSGVALDLPAGSGAAPLLVTGGGVAAWLAWLAAINGLLEVARADMVLRGDRRAAAAVGRALALLGRRRLLASASLAWLALAVLGGLYWAVGVAAAGAVPPEALLAGLALQQVVALGGAWLKLLRLAVAVQIAQAS